LVRKKQELLPSNIPLQFCLHMAGHQHLCTATAEMTSNPFQNSHKGIIMPQKPC